MGGAAIWAHRFARGSYSAAPSGHGLAGGWIAMRSRPSQSASGLHIWIGAGGIRTQ
jgi:hypothetical protein